MTIVPFTRRPVSDEHGVVVKDCETGEVSLLRECADPVHVFENRGAACQCGLNWWGADEPAPGGQAP